MSLDFVLNLFDAVIILSVSIPAVLMATRIKVSVLRRLGVLLAAFFVVHGLYHLAAVVSAAYGGDALGFLSDGLMEPVSYLLLVVFGVTLYSLER